MNKRNLKLKTMYLSIPQNEILRYNLTKYIQDLYEENYKTVMYKFEELSM